MKSFKIRPCLYASVICSTGKVSRFNYNLNYREAMNKFYKLTILAASYLLLSHFSVPVDANASGGSYQSNTKRSSGGYRHKSNSVSRTKKSSSSSDAYLKQNQYNLGKRILLGDAPLKQFSEELAEGQTKSLTKIYEQLPASAQQKLNISAISGRLSPQQLAAVEYYLKKRYLQ